MRRVLSGVHGLVYQVGRKPRLIHCDIVLKVPFSMLFLIKIMAQCIGMFNFSMSDADFSEK